MDHRDTAPGSVTSLTDVAAETGDVTTEPSDGFGPLKAFLGNISATFIGYKVHLLCPLFRSPP